VEVAESHAQKSTAYELSIRELRAEEHSIRARHQRGRGQSIACPAARRQSAQDVCPGGHDRAR
jgi:hypothetical protein